MVVSSVMKRAVIVGGLVLAVPAVAVAQYAVNDAQSNGILEAIRGINQSSFMEQVRNWKDEITFWKQQFDFLNDIKELSKEIMEISTAISDAVGEIGSWTIPIPNLDKLKQQIKSEAKCLASFDFLAGLDTEDLDFGSLCGARKAYKDTLFADPSKLKGKSHDERMAAYGQVEKRRNQLVADAGVEALAMSRITLGSDGQGSDMQAVIDGLQDVVNGAETLNQRAAAQAQIQLAILQVLNQQSRLQAAQLQLMAARSIQQDLNLSTVTAAKGTTP